MFMIMLVIESINILTAFSMAVKTSLPLICHLR
jgi:hypothetical protein